MASSGQEVNTGSVPPDWDDHKLLVAIYGAQARMEAKVDSLREYVEQIEREAHEAMGGLTDPDNMMKMAGQFLGMSPKG